MKLSRNHKILLDIVFQRVHPKEFSGGKRKVPHERVDVAALYLMQDLIKLEFYASLQKEIENNEEGSAIMVPNPYDVCLVEPTFRNRNIYIAVAVPGKKDDMLWYDENDYLWHLDDLVATRKVSSLSGTVRILDCLETRAIPTLMEEAMNRTNLFDAKTLKFETVSNERLNTSQNEAVLAVNSKNFNGGFFVVQGPPGTGKSTTLVEMICSTNDQVIASAPSNAATANIALKLFATSKFHHLDLCVYGQGCDKSVFFLNPTLRRKRYEAFARKFEDEMNEEKAKTMLRQFCEWLRLPVDSSFEAVRSICASSNYFHRAQVVCCTLNSSGSVWFRKNSGKRDTFYLDEAGQTSEAEFYLATTFPEIKRVVVVGDPRQLPPTIIEKGCKQAGLGISWMERVCQIYPSKVHLLDTQYRMDPTILRFPNQEFYGNRIKSGKNLLSRLPIVSKAVGFLDTSDRSYEEQENFSTRNSQEASLIRALLRQDEDVKSILREVPNVKVVALTPYIAQKKLLEVELKKVKDLSKCNWTVSTVDSYQGQEADIVIISTVRSKRVGFVDDPQRLNVALTRAKRLLRIVGCKKLFDTLGARSTLRKLTTYLCDQKFLVVANVKNTAFSIPDWNEPSLWKATLTQRFHHCLKSMPSKEMTLSLRTLQAVTTPNMRLLHKQPSEGYWQVSSLREYPQCSIVWVAKNDDSIEAHFAGTRNKCLTFVQKNIATLPRGSCLVKPDLTGTRSQFEGAAVVMPSWDLENILQRAIENSSIKELPEGTLHLDPTQNAIVSARPPLLLESRSGTGKTNVLFQHSLLLSQELVAVSDTMPLAFLTVSKLLTKQLQKLHHDIKGINKAALQSCVFMSLSDLLDGLAERMGMQMGTTNMICFKDYVLERRSYVPLNIDPTLVENEIGGVIMGSLKAAELRRPLKWEEYEMHSRSNVSRKDLEGSSSRRLIYQQYRLYNDWKSQNGRFDINDLVLEILKNLVKIDCRERQIFSAVYLDEVQDFSYAMIYLVCSIGGTSDLNWIFAGDTAQMISPGCSFKFAGLKETLLSIQPGIEAKLRQVEHLTVNYRTTKDVLEVANAILMKAKHFFPGAIEFARKEEAVNDYGLKVVLSDWDTSLTTRPSFGQDQAIVYSCSKAREDDSIKSIKQWVGDHPFILTVLDSKGLEFDDIVVAFDLDQKSWKAESQELVALNMMRELYVAVTRAKRRVVILVKKRSYAMLNFFSSLNYEVKYHSDPMKLFEEFNTCTSKEQWLQKADHLFQKEQYFMAYRCYEKSESPALAALALGKHFIQERCKSKAANEFIRACDLFYDLCNYKAILDIASDLLDVVSWENEEFMFINDEYFKVSISQYPNYLENRILNKIDIYHDRWDRISIEDIKREAIIVNKRRGFPGLIKFIETFPDTETQKMCLVIPCIIGDLLRSRKRYIEAINLYFRGGDFAKAEETSVKMIHILKKKAKPNELLELADLWLSNKQNNVSNRTISLLLRLIDDPEKVAIDHSSQCLDHFGTHAIKFIVYHRDLDPTCLYAFCPASFHDEVLEELKLNFKEDPIQIVKWFHSRKNKKHAMDFVLERLSEWKTHELRTFTNMDLISEEVSQEFAKRSQYLDAINLFMKCEKVEMAYKTANDAVSSIKYAENNALKVMQTLRGLAKPKNIPQRIKILSELFLRPDEMERKQCEEAMKAFGPYVIQEFILRTASYGNPPKTDILEVLSRFGKKAKMSRRAVLEDLHSRKIASPSFIEYHLECWTVKDLFDIVDKFGYRSHTLGKEFCRRQRYTKAAEIFLHEARYDEAVDACESAIASPALATQNALGVRRLWLTDTNESRHMKIQNSLKSDSLLYQFLTMWQNPKVITTDELVPTREPTLAACCVQHFGPSMIKQAVLKSFLMCPETFSTDPLNVLHCFNPYCDAFERLSSLDILRELNAISRKSDYSAKHYAEKHASFFASIVRSLSNQDLALFVTLQVRIIDIELVLKERKMYAEIVKLYIDWNKIHEAISYSTFALDDKNFEKHITDLVDVWEGAFSTYYDKLVIDHIPSDTKLWILLRLFRNPISISDSELGSECIPRLGPKIVEIAVHRKVVPNRVGDTLRDFDSKYFADYGRKHHNKSKVQQKRPKRTKK